MKISDYQRTKILKRMPNLKLSYETIHNKVLSDMYFLIPKGKKYIVWFTYLRDKKVCIFIEVNSYKKTYGEIFVVPQTFEKKLVLGTIFYGTLFKVNENKFFSIENIHYYRGKNIANYNEKTKLNTIKNILESELKQKIIGNKGICIGMTVVLDSFEKAIIASRTLPYIVYSIQNRNYNDKSNNYKAILYKSKSNETEIYKYFYIKADIQNDIYYLFIKDNHNNLIKKGIADIPNYKTSIMMNRLFRTIKENISLDALEESDDEEEFENINLDKFVDLEKCVKMECKYNKTRDRFVPIKVVS